MIKCLLFLLLLLICIGTLWAQYDYIDSESDSNELGTPVETGTDNIPNKYIVISLCVIFIAGFYFLFLGYFPNLLDTGLSPLTAASMQCIRFSIISALIILLGVYALSGFALSNFMQIILNNIGFMSMIVVVWFVYLIIAISNKSKGDSK